VQGFGRCSARPGRGRCNSGGARRAQVSISDGEMLRRQFYFAVAVHERAGQLRGLTAEAAAEKESLLRGARNGAARPLPHAPP